jgi:pyruvate formate lyase activating enzyme
MIELLTYPTVHEARLYEARGDKLQCNLCERHCVIANGNKGYCRSRMNIKGKLYTLSYGNLSAIESRPIEIKPFFHFHPGSTALTFSPWSCNMSCPWCQNYHLSRTPPNPLHSRYFSPEALVDMAIIGGDEGLCGSFTEPTLLFEYALDAFPIARKRNLYNCFVSNGYLTSQALRRLAGAGMDAIKIDLKGSTETYRQYCAANVEVVWRNIEEAKKLGLHVEIVNLVITDVNDDEDCLREIIQRALEIDPEMPLHFTRYHPAYQFTKPRTEIQTLEKAYEMARNTGVKYPYIGNVPGHSYENTYCPSCERLLIKRLNYKIISYNITRDKKCPECGNKIIITGEYVKNRFAL